MQAQNRAVLSKVRRRKAAGVVRLRVLRRMRSILDWAFFFLFFVPSSSCLAFVLSSVVEASARLDSGDSAGLWSRAGVFKFACAEKFSSSSTLSSLSLEEK